MNRCVTLLVQQSTPRDTSWRSGCSIHQNKTKRSFSAAKEFLILLLFCALGEMWARCCGTNNRRTFLWSGRWFYHCFTAWPFYKYFKGTYKCFSNIPLIKLLLTMSHKRRMWIHQCSLSLKYWPCLLLFLFLNIYFLV